MVRIEAIYRVPEFERLAHDLIHATIELNKAYDDIRRSVAELAGCDIDDWSIRDILTYVDLALAEYRTKLLL